MHLVAAARVRRAQDALLAARPYAQQMDALLGRLASQVDRSVHPMLAEREAQKVCLVLVTSDRGLCGSFNSSLIRRASELRTRYGDLPCEMVCVGRKGWNFLRKQGFSVIEDYCGAFQRAPVFGSAQAVTDEVMRQFMDGEVDRVDVVYSASKSVIWPSAVGCWRCCARA